MLYSNDNLKEIELVLRVGAPIQTKLVFFLNRVVLENYSVIVARFYGTKEMLKTCYSNHVFFCFVLV